MFQLDVMPTGGGGPTLVVWALGYLETKVIGIQSPNTEEAKKRDLGSFLKFFSELNGHLNIEQWFPRDTQAYLKHLEGQGRAPATVNRHFRTLRHFGRWVHEQPNTPFAAIGLPTAGVQELAMDEAEAKKFEKREIYALFKAADNLVLLDTHRDARPKRNRAILSVMYFTGLRVTELVNLKLDQFDGKRFRNVLRKGRVRTKLLYLPPEGRQALYDYLQDERRLGDNTAPWLFLSTTSRHGQLTRRHVHRVLDRIANEATKNGGEIHMHPHRLRHTFGFNVRAKTQSDSETARLLGHQTDKYAGRYARATQAEREALLDTLEVGLG